MSKTIINHPRVLDYDSDLGEGHIVTLKAGFAWSDAAERPGNDPDGSFANHTRRFETVRDFQRAVRHAETCLCGRCLRGERA